MGCYSSDPIRFLMRIKKLKIKSKELFKSVNKVEKKIIALIINSR